MAGHHVAERRPKYEEVRVALAAELEGRVADEPLPSERELMVSYGVSRMTVRQAIAGLAEAGLVYRVQGSGTFVADPARVTKSLHLTSFTEDIRGRSMTPGSELLVSERVPADAAAALALSLEPGTEVVHVERLRTADGSPMCLENAWVPGTLVRDLFRSDGSASLYDMLARVGARPEYAEQRVTATVLPRREAELLQVPTSSAALVVARVTFDARSRAVERAVSLYRADRYDFEFTVTRGRVRGPR